MPRTNYPNPRGYADKIVTKAPDWHDLVVFDVLFNNLTTGLYLTAACCDLVYPSVFSNVATWAYPLALVLLLIDLALLVLDLGDPLRFHHMLRVFKPSSPMSLGTWCLTAYSLILSAVIAICFVETYLLHDAGLRWARMALVAFGIPFAFGSAAYKGVLFSTSAQPGWRDARWFGAYLMNSAIVLGLAELMLIGSIMGDPKALQPLTLPLVLLIMLNYLISDLLLYSFQDVIQKCAFKKNHRLVWAIIKNSGEAIPIIALLISSAIASIVIAFIALVLSQLAVRWLVVHLPHWLANERPDALT